MFTVNMIHVNTFATKVAMETMGTRLRKARIEAGFTSARSAAIRFGWPTSTYAAHENGQNSFDGALAMRYARAFKTDFSWLMFGYEEYATYVPIIGSIESSSNIRHSSILISSMKEDGTFSFDNTKSIAKLLIQQMPGLSAFHSFSVLGSNMFPRYSDDDLILTNFGNGDIIENREIIYENEKGKLQFGIAVSLKSLEVRLDQFHGDLFDTEHGLIKNIRINRVWQIAIVVRKGFWTRVEMNDPAWAFSLRRMVSTQDV